ncbi:MAG: dihydroorotase [Candidatus Parcubacteria bacterium]|jgi:dihydroorotase
MQISENSIVMLGLDNLHFHARDGILKGITLKYLLPYCDRATIMPNLGPPILTGAQADNYRLHIMQTVKDLGYQTFTPLMTIYITEETTIEMIHHAYLCGVRYVKVYPKNVTTGSKYGVEDYRKIIPVLKAAHDHGMIVLLHGEHPDYSVEGMDKESQFVRDILPILLSECPGKFVLEHVSDAESVGFILSEWDKNGRKRLAGTITPHHLIHTHDDVAGYGPVSGFQANPVLHCKPCIKYHADREALQRVVLSGAPCFFYGGDDAPHIDTKRRITGCACGVWNTIAAPSVLIEFFEVHNKLTLLEGFTSKFGAEFYGIPYNTRKICFVREEWVVPSSVLVEGTSDSLTPWMAGQMMKWKQKPIV